MSDSDEDEALFFGTPLEPYDEDAFPKKKPVTVEEQVARDAQGRRRFHGAFTGGFSAGFYNTVGSLEGWTPQEFRSSRSEKTVNVQQRPEDFMDDEDVGEFGIAPQTVRTTKEYSNDKKRKRFAFSDGPIPGEPVLETLLQAGNETVGYFLMKNMKRKQHKVTVESTGPKVYGCAMPTDLSENEETEGPEYKLHDVYKQYLSHPKSNTFGLGYTGLDKTHTNLFQPTKLKVRERNNKKVAISGQAFGVGAFEDEDEDIYVKDDMSRYDFELTTETSSKDKKPKTQKEASVLDVFVVSKVPLVAIPKYPLPVIPSSFTGKHNVKKSRFEPLQKEQEPPKRHEIDATVRAKYLGEDCTDKTYTPSNRQRRWKETEPVVKTEPKRADESTSGGLFDRFVSAKQDDDPTNILEPVKATEETHGTEEMRAAVKMKMFGPLTRVTIPWQPCSLLCKKFNVPEPNVSFDAEKNKKRTKNLIFEYQKHSEEDKVPTKPGLFTPQASSSHPPDSAEQTSEIVQETEIKKESEPETTTETESQQENLEISTEKQPEKSLDPTERVDVSKNMDLFKAVFLSSSESESEEEENGNKTVADEEKRKKELMTASVLSEPLVPKIKSTKTGILSNIDFTKITATKENNQTETNKTGGGEEVDIYGPKLPHSIVRTNSASISTPKDVVPVQNDEWVEKDEGKDKKHKKKRKKEKSGHKKKHKHKSKR